MLQRHSDVWGCTVRFWLTAWISLFSRFLARPLWADLTNDHSWACHLVMSCGRSLGRANHRSLLIYVRVDKLHIGISMACVIPGWVFHVGSYGWLVIREALLESVLPLYFVAMDEQIWNIFRYISDIHRLDRQHDDSRSFVMSLVYTHIIQYSSEKFSGWNLLIVLFFLKNS